jgi:signal transduction histidine kinase
MAMKTIFGQYKDILDLLPSIIICTDLEGNVLYGNPAAHRHLGLDALGPVPLQKADISWEKNRIAAAFETCMSTGTPERIDDLRFDTPKGLKFLGFTLYLQRGDTAETSVVIWSGADITTRKTLMEQLRQSQKMEAVGQLAAGVAHEINTPTQYILDNLYFLRDTVTDLKRLFELMSPLLLFARAQQVANIADIDEFQESIDLDFLLTEAPSAATQCIEGAGQIANIVGAMKEFAHPEMEEKTLCDVNRIVRNTLTVSKNEWKFVAKTETSFANDIPNILCVPGVMNQVLLNLIVNAAHAVADRKNQEGASFEGIIHCSTRLNDDHVELTVADNGAGIPESIRERIFEPFFTTKPVGKGTGQGLAIAHDAVVNKHNGQILCHSDPGRGTRFTIRLPLTQEEATDL